MTDDDWRGRTIELRELAALILRSIPAQESFEIDGPTEQAFTVLVNRVADAIGLPLNARMEFVRAALIAKQPPMETETSFRPYDPEKDGPLSE